MTSTVARAYNGDLRALTPVGSRTDSLVAGGDGEAGSPFSLGRLNEGQICPFLNFQMIKHTNPHNLSHCLTKRVQQLKKT